VDFGSEHTAFTIEVKLEHLINSDLNEEVIGEYVVSYDLALFLYRIFRLLCYSG
jgi:hypothetical protein